MQEVESREILDDFHEFYLEKSNRAHYGWRRLIDGNDIRGIDVGVMSKNRISVISHADVTFGDFDLFNNDLLAYGLSEGDSIFRRDCLEVNLNVEDNPLSIYVCHFKSMCGGRAETRCIREAESRAVCRLVRDKFGNSIDKKDWLIVGDLNDYIIHNGHADNNHGLGPLFDDINATNLLDNIPIDDRWTHYYSGDNTRHQLDFILASPSLADKNDNVVPEIIRGGQPLRVPGIEDVRRYPRIGFDRPKASDHCPVVVELEL
jgi:endonuclease/exonuclease/phosphatase family metal-dependent hydrolase